MKLKYKMCVHEFGVVLNRNTSEMFYHKFRKKRLFCGEYVSVSLISTYVSFVEVRYNFVDIEEPCAPSEWRAL